MVRTAAAALRSDGSGGDFCFIQYWRGERGVRRKPVGMSGKGGLWVKMSTIEHIKHVSKSKPVRERNYQKNKRCKRRAVFRGASLIRVLINQHFHTFELNAVGYFYSSTFTPY